MDNDNQRNTGSNTANNIDNNIDNHNETDIRFELSVVIPVYNGAATVGTLVEKLCELEQHTAFQSNTLKDSAFQKNPNLLAPLEIILVVDGSPDNSLEICQQLSSQYSTPISVVNLSRNFGEHNAVMAGLHEASGAYIINMDDDLQNPPEEIIKLWQHSKNQALDVCYTYYAQKQHASWRNWGSRFTNWCAGVLLDKPKGLYLSSFRCMSHFVAKQICKHQGPYPYIDGLLLQVTQTVDSIQVEHLPRADGDSNYTLARLLRLFLSMFLNFSVIPLRFATAAGIIIGITGFIGMLGIFIEMLIGDATPRGWASLMVGILLLTGTQLIMLGVIGEYLGRLFLTSNQKPQFIVRNISRNNVVQNHVTQNSVTRNDSAKNNISDDNATQHGASHNQTKSPTN